jgi:hypothetical protein
MDATTQKPVSLIEDGGQRFEIRGKVPGGELEFIGWAGHGELEATTRLLCLASFAGYREVVFLDRQTGKSYDMTLPTAAA